MTLSLISGSGVSLTPYSPISTSGIGNAQTFPHIRTALAKVLSGAGQMKVGFVGDSTTAGNDATTGLVAAQPWCPAAQVASQMASSRFKVRADAFMGLQSASLNTQALVHGYDARLSLGTNILAGGQTTFGFGDFGTIATGTGSAADTLSFTPAGAFDTLEIYTNAHTGWGSVAVNVDGGATVVTINLNQATNTFQKTVQAVTRVTGGTHVINLVCTGVCHITGVLAYDSTVPAVNCLNFGWNSGSLAQIIASNAFPWNPGATSVAGSSGLGCYGLDATIIYIGLNDLPGGQNTPISAYQAGLQQLIAAAQVTGDCIVMTMWGNGISSDANTIAYNSAIKNAALATNATVIDQFPQYGGVGNGQILGLLGADNTHPTHSGYADRGNIVSDILFNFS